MEVKAVMLVLAASVAVSSAFWSPEPTYHTCCASGDPHYYPYDGGVIHFQGVCRYLLTGTCPCSAMDPFHVYVENARPSWSSSVSITKLVEIHINGWIVQFQQSGIVNVRNPSLTWYNNVAVPYFIPGGTITKPSWNHMVFEASNGIKVEYSDNHHVCVHVPCKYEDEMCGICGNMNNVFDDYVTSAGVDVSSSPNIYSLIGNSWQVSPVPWSPLPQICYRSPFGRTAPDFAPDRTVDTTRCGKMKELTECVRAIPELFRHHHESCQYDVAAATGARGAHCDTVQSFINACEEATGTDITGWREKFGCPCPDGSYNDPCPRVLKGAVAEALAPARG